MESSDSTNFGQDTLLTDPNQESYQKYIHSVLGIQSRQFPVKRIISKVPRLPSINTDSKIEPLVSDVLILKNSESNLARIDNSFLCTLGN